MAGTAKRIAGPAYIANAAANIYTPPASTIWTLIKHIHVANKTAGAQTYSLYIGATGGSAGGTEIVGGKSVAANDTGDLYFTPGIYMASTDFLSGVCSAASSIVITVLGEQGVV